MRNFKLFIVAIFIFATLAIGQTFVGSIFKLAILTESAFPVTSSVYTAGLVYGQDGGVPYFNNGSRFVPFAFPQEFGSSSFTAGQKAITFTNQFLVAPVCVCSDTSGSALACSTNTSSVSGVTFFGTLTDAFNWWCVSTK